MEERPRINIKDTALSLLSKIKGFDLGATVSKWWSNESKAAKIAFLSAIIIGFISHLFIYTNRFFGNHDVGVYWYQHAAIATGRWFPSIYNLISYGYVIPLLNGLLVSFYLAVSAFFICKIFDVHWKTNAVLIAALMATFPSIAHTNLFLIATSDYHFSVMLSVIAVYIAYRYKLGFIVGAVLIMLMLASYQSKLNVALALALFLLVFHSTSDDFSFKSIRNLFLRFTALFATGGLLYAISLPISFRHFNVADLGGHRGFSVDSLRDRLLSVTGFIENVKTTYRQWFDSFRGSIYIVVDPLWYAYIAVAILGITFLIAIIVKKKIYKQPFRLMFIAALLVLIPFASNFTGFLAVSITGLMIYAFVLVLCFIVALAERHRIRVPFVNSILVVCMFFIVGNFIVVNNEFYLRAYFFNQRMHSLTTRIADRIDPLLPLMESHPRQFTVIGYLPNEYLHTQTGLFDRFGQTNDHGLYHQPFVFVSVEGFNRTVSLLGSGLNYLHGTHFRMILIGDERDQIKEDTLNTNMPVWPAEGSVGLINDVIVVNFGVTDVIFEEDESGQFFRARHWISEGHEEHNYLYHWAVFRNGEWVGNFITDYDRLYMNFPYLHDNYQVSVRIENATIGFEHPVVGIELPAGAFAPTNITRLYMTDEYGFFIRNENPIEINFMWSGPQTEFDFYFDANEDYLFRLNTAWLIPEVLGDLNMQFIIDSGHGEFVVYDTIVGSSTASVEFIVPQNMLQGRHHTLRVIGDTWCTTQLGYDIYRNLGIPIESVEAIPISELGQ